MQKIWHRRSRFSPRFTLGAMLTVLGFQPSTFGLAAVPGAEVAAVKSGRIADLIILSGGFEAGLRQGMVCRVTRNQVDIAEVLLVELRSSCSTALILSLADQQSIRAGDVASIKILKS